MLDLLVFRVEPVDPNWTHEVLGDTRELTLVGVLDTLCDLSNMGGWSFEIDVIHTDLGSEIPLIDIYNPDGDLVFRFVNDKVNSPTAALRIVYELTDRLRDQVRRG